MDELTKHNQQLSLQDYEIIEDMSKQHTSPMETLVKPTLRRWYLILIFAILIPGIAIPLIFFKVEPTYQALGIIEIQPIMSNILFSDRDSEVPMPMYTNFKNTQAQIIQSDNVLHHVDAYLPDDKDNYKSFISNEFKSTETLTTYEYLKYALKNDLLKITSGERDQLIYITLKSKYPDEAVKIVDAITSAYMKDDGTSSELDGVNAINMLKDQQTRIETTLTELRDTKRRLAAGEGSTELSGQYAISMERIAALQSELTQLQSDKRNVETKIILLENSNKENVNPEGSLERKHNLVNSDPTIIALTDRVAELEQALIISEQNLNEGNPELEQKKELLTAFKKRLDERRAEIEEDFKQSIKEEIEKSQINQLNQASAEKTQLETHEAILKENLEEETARAKDLGLIQLNIDQTEEDITNTKELLNQIKRRIQVLEVEKNRPARISVRAQASITETPDRRIIFAAASLAGGLGIGLCLAFLLGKLDKNLYTPDDIIRCIGVPIIGTTTNAEQVDQKLLSDHVAYDYQTIHANLSLLTNGNIPKILTVTSARMGEGKTTLSINLATSLAKTGKKVLLIDGDLRKPDIARTLNLPGNSWGLADVLLGLKTFEESIYTIPLTGLDVLIADRRNNNSAIDQLNKSQTHECIHQISEHYDHIIIDTPPVLAAPDALIWSKIASATVLSSLAGQSNSNELKEAISRLSNLNIKILGNILSNVDYKSSYNRYGYDYYGANNGKNRKDRPLLVHTSSTEEN